MPTSTTLSTRWSSTSRRAGGCRAAPAAASGGPATTLTRGRRWRYLDLAGMKLLLRYDVRRVACRRFGLRVEQFPWAEFGSCFTRPFEDQVGYLAQRADETTVAILIA